MEPTQKVLETLKNSDKPFESESCRIRFFYDIINKITALA